MITAPALRGQTSSPAEGRVRGRPLGLAGWEDAGQERSAFLDSHLGEELGWGERGGWRAGGRRRRGWGEQPPCTSPSPLALQQPDFPEMMGRRRPMGALAALGEAGPGPGWGNPAKCLDCGPAPLPWQIAPLLRRGRTCVRARWSRGQREPCPAKASRAQRPRDPATRASFAFSLLPASESRSLLRDPRIPPPIRARCRGEPAAFDAGEGAGHGWHRTETRGAPGSGGWKPQAGEPRACGVAWAPARTREGAGGTAGCCAGRAGGARGCGRPAAFADLCAQSRGGPRRARSQRASASRAGDSSVRPCMGALCLAPRRQASGCPCRWQQAWGLLPWAAGESAQAAGGGGTGVWFQEPRWEGCASRQLHCCGRGSGRGCLRCRLTARPLGKGHSFISSREIS